MEILFAVSFLVGIISAVLYVLGLIADRLLPFIENWMYDRRMKKLYGDLYFQVRRRT